MPTEQDERRRPLSVPLREPPQVEPGEKLQRRVKNTTAAELSLTKSRANDMTTIHDDDPGSRIRELERSLLRSQRERDALALRKDELESVLAVGRLGFCRLDESTRALSANSQFKADFGWPPDAEITWCGLEERIQRADRQRLADAAEAAFATGGSRCHRAHPTQRSRSTMDHDARSHDQLR